MFKNYFKIAWRNLVRNKVASFINIGGLAVGMAVAILIGFWIWDELSFDKYNSHYDRIAEVMQHANINGDKFTGNTVPYPMGAALRKEFGEDFRQVLMATFNANHLLSYGDKRLNVTGSFFEPGVTDMLDLDMVKGSRGGLKDPASILLSVSQARAWFGEADPLNKVMTIDNDKRLSVKVTGVYEDFPRNSGFAGMSFIAPWELFASNSDWIKGMKDTWRCNCFLSYVQVADHADMDKVSHEIKDIKLDKVNKSELKGKPEVFLHPMSKWHLFSDFKNGVNTGGRIQYVWLFGIIGAFVLLLACINFMNLSTARSERRAKEVGIRKTIGSLRRQLIYQFFCESMLVAVFAFILSLLLVQLSLPFFNEVADKQLSILWNRPLFWVLGIGFTAFTGLIAGSYPALYLSSFQPIKVLKGSFRVGALAAMPRKILVVLQFTVSVILIIGTIVVFRQIQFAKSRPVGYNREGLVALPMGTPEIHNHFAAVQDQLLKAGAITRLAEAGNPGTYVSSTNAGFNWKGKDPGLSVDFPNLEVSSEYGRTVGWQFKEGRDFSKDFATDSLAFVLNESAAKYMGLKNPVGEIITWDSVPYTVIGVIKDMVMESPFEPVRPSLFHLSKDAQDFVIAKIDPHSSASNALEKIRKVFTATNPAQPFEYQFVDAEYAKKFGYEERIGKLASAFAGLAIFISCLGLFGMASFMAEQRIKEVGVRKVLGASVFNLWRLLSTDFVVLVIISLLIATPLAYFFMHNWLQNYQYRAEISWWIFVAAGVGALLITLVTVSYQSIRAATSNPVKSLRSE
ncbi:MAG TPA: ABC transporter permease [Puia sp.]|nr:ABC transporter permease [Puia sp.]